MNSYPTSFPDHPAVLFRCSTITSLARLALFVLFCSWLTGPGRGLADDSPEYLRDVKPLLQARCYACHGALKQEAGLRLDTVAAMRRGGDAGPAMKAGEPASSLLLRRVTADDVAERMPPEHEGEPLKPEEIERLRRWIAAGAQGPTNEQPEPDPRDHWAFRQPTRPAVPLDGHQTWSRGAIDAFISSEQRRQQLQPLGEASRLLLVRRLYLDLIGVPPSAEVIADVRQDEMVDWYERLVDRLLSDPRHGERWGRHWMDVWRYSDWWGLGDQLRNSQKHIWHWRDWIVESLNQDLPYDEMIRQMLAADELYPTDLGKLRATGYLARNYFLFNRHQWMDETIEHVGKSFLGLTLNCAKCHDHKYDPLSQEDYYRMRAIFEPYHVRVDQVPGEMDLAVNGVPRAFDGLPDDPTYRLIRGQESQPDKTRSLTPSTPAIFRFAEFAVRPVALPGEAWQPGRRTWVLESQLAAARRQLSQATTALEDVRRKAAEITKAADVQRAADSQKAAAVQAASEMAQAAVAKKTATETSPAAAAKPEADAAGKVARVADKLEQLDPRRWKLFGGDWVHESGKLAQRRDGATRAAVRYLGDLPRDFDVTARFTIVGGSQWRSVGVSFDTTVADPTMDGGNDDTEQNVYISANRGEPKLQAAYRQAGTWHYPAAGKVAQPIPLNEPQTLRVQIRDTLINVTLNGKLQLAWRTPLARRAGALQFITFDALAVFHELSIEPLAASVTLVEAAKSPAERPGKQPAAVVETPAELAAQQPALVAVAEAQHLVAVKRLESVERRAEAVQSAAAAAAAASDVGGGGSTKTDGPPPTISPSSPAVQEAARVAVKAERELAVATTQLALAELELREVRSRLAAARGGADNKTAVDKRAADEAAISKERTKLQETLAAALKAVNEASTKFTEFAGAAWTPTRFFNSNKDDPEVTFKPMSTGRRTALAHWITDPRNPLTARVAVNQIWMRHWGTPLVSTVFDFGRKGQRPTHPALIDWLALELQENNWSMKQLHRQLVLSATYRLSSDTTSATEMVADRDNRFWTRRVPIRLESQTVRDQLLALAQNLDYRQGGPPVAAAQQATSARRSLYFFHSNNERNLFLTTFDEALVKDCYRREQSIVPQQALAMTNSQLVLDTAAAVALRIAREELVSQAAPAEQDALFVRSAFRQLLASEPSPEEERACLAALAGWRGQPGETFDTARAHLIWVLLNHNDLITLR